MRRRRLDPLASTPIIIIVPPLLSSRGADPGRVLDHVGQLIAIADDRAGFGSVERQADNLKQLMGGPADGDVRIAAIVGEDQRASVRQQEPRLIRVVRHPGDGLAITGHGIGEPGHVRRPAARRRVCQPVFDGGHREQRIDPVVTVERERGVDARRCTTS